MLYKCYICGREYESARDAANCTLNCSNKAEESEKEAKLKEIRDKIDIRYKELKDLCKQYSDISTTEFVDISLTTCAKLVYNSNNLNNLNYINCSNNTENNYKTVSNTTTTDKSNTPKNTSKPQNCVVNNVWNDFDNMFKEQLKQIYGNDF